jgi:hypothetical protein
MTRGLQNAVSKHVTCISLASASILFGLFCFWEQQEPSGSTKVQSTAQTCLYDVIASVVKRQAPFPYPISKEGLCSVSKTHNLDSWIESVLSPKQTNSGSEVSVCCHHCRGRHCSEAVIHYLFPKATRVRDANPSLACVGQPPTDTKYALLCITAK